MIAEKYQIAYSRPNPERREKNCRSPSKGTVTLLDRLDPRESKMLSFEMRDLLDRGCRNWEFILDQLESCDASILGIFLGAHATIKKRSGKLEFKVKSDSEVHRLLTLAKLDRVLWITTC